MILNCMNYVRMDILGMDALVILVNVWSFYIEDKVSIL